MRLVSLNIRTSAAIGDRRNHWFFRRARLSKFLVDFGADVIALQEVRPGSLHYLRRRLRGYRCVAVGREVDNRGEACPVLVGPSLRIIDSETRWFSETPAVAGSRFAGARHPRICTFVRLVDEHGSVFVVANLHLDAMNAELRARSVAMLNGWAAGDDVPWVLVGDFNCKIDSPEMSAVACFNDALADLKGGTFRPFGGHVEGLRIDHVLVSEGFVVESARILSDIEVSDHLPIEVQLTRSIAEG